MKTFFWCIAVIFFMAVSAQAEILHASTQHPGGDCSWLCSGSCSDSIKRKEEGLGTGSCANFGDDYGTYGPAEGYCSSDEAGPGWRVMNCNLTNGCETWGVLKCPGFYNGVWGIKWPSFEFNCPVRNGKLPNAFVAVGFAGCDYEEEGIHNSVYCTASGGIRTVTFND